METIYIASKTKHAPRWRALREQGIDINSTWIDEAGPGESADLSDLGLRCISEACSADWLILYCGPGEVLKGALMEVGAALAARREVYVVGDCDSLRTVVLSHPNVRRVERLEDALPKGMVAGALST